jgi:hypothetical protein
MSKKPEDVYNCDFIHEYNSVTGIVTHSIEFKNLEDVWNQYDDGTFPFQIEHFEKYRSDLVEKIKRLYSSGDFITGFYVSGIDDMSNEDLYSQFCSIGIEGEWEDGEENGETFFETIEDAVEDLDSDGDIDGNPVLGKWDVKSDSFCVNLEWHAPSWVAAIYTSVDDYSVDFEELYQVLRGWYVDMDID